MAKQTQTSVYFYSFSTRNDTRILETLKVMLILWLNHDNNRDENRDNNRDNNWDEKCHVQRGWFPLWLMNCYITYIAHPAVSWTAMTTMKI